MKGKNRSVSGENRDMTDVMMGTKEDTTLLLKSGLKCYEIVSCFCKIDLARVIKPKSMFLKGRLFRSGVSPGPQNKPECSLRKAAAFPMKNKSTFCDSSAPGDSSIPEEAADVFLGDPFLLTVVPTMNFETSKTPFFFWGLKTFGERPWLNAPSHRNLDLSASRRWSFRPAARRPSPCHVMSFRRRPWRDGQVTTTALQQVCKEMDFKAKTKKHSVLLGVWWCLHCWKLKNVNTEQLDACQKT